MSWKRSQESLYLSIWHHNWEESSFHQNLNSLVTFFTSNIFCGFQYHRSFVLSFLPFQLTSSILCLYTFIVKTVLVCSFLFPAFCLLCHEAAVQAPFSPLTTTASYCVFFTRTTEMVALREMYQFISLRL